MLERDTFKIKPRLKSIRVQNQPNQNQPDQFQEQHTDQG